MSTISNVLVEDHAEAEGGDSERMHCMEVWGGNRGTDKSFEMPGLRTWVFSRPYREAHSGGDVYYVSSCASGRITRVLLADVVGHGNLAADTARGLRDLMRENINMLRQTSLVRALNQRFAEVEKQGGFATALVGTFFAPQRSLAVCNAGHPLPLVYRVSESQWSPLERHPADESKLVDIPLGILNEVEYQMTETRLDVGDLVLGFSDALSESRDRKGQLLDVEGILRHVRKLDVSKPETLIPSLLEAILDESSENLSHDDLTVVLLQVAETRSTIKDNLLAPFRILGSAAENTEFRTE